MPYDPTMDEKEESSDIESDTENDADDDTDTGLTHFAPKKISRSSSLSSSSSATKTVPSICKVCAMNEINIAMSPCGDVKICECCWLRIAKEHEEQIANDSIDHDDEEELKPKCPCCKQGVDT